MRVKKRSMSHIIAGGVLAVDAAAVAVVLFLCYLSVERSFTGTLPYLTALVGALQTATAVVLASYFGKSKAENTMGGIVYDAAARTDWDC